MNTDRNKITAGSQIALMYLLASLVYFMSYMTRVNYNTVLVEIASAEKISRSLLVLPLTASFITYGFGQIISGWMGDRFDAFRLIFFGLILSAAMNFLLPLFPGPQIMLIFWAVNGFAQALIYPPLMKITSYYLSEQNYAKACLFITFGSHGATLLLYLAVPVIIAVSGWKMVFRLSFFCAAIFAGVWLLYARAVKRKYGMPEKMGLAPESRASLPLTRILFSSGLLLIMTAVVMQGFLRDGIAAWMPAYLADVFSLSNEISILTTVVLPLFSIASAYLIMIVRNRICRNELKLAGLTFLTAAGAILLLLLFRKNMPLSVLFLAMTSACSHAVNFLLICLVPTKFEKYGKFSLMTGLINSCTYLGAAISTYGFAAVSETYGWDVTLKLWGIIALTGFLCCIAALRRWNRFSGL